MDELGRAAFGLEINIQLRMAFDAWNRIRDATFVPLPDDERERFERVMGIFRDFPVLVTTAGIISDLFFPQKGRGDDEDRVEALRVEYRVGPNSPLAGRAVRNSMVHAGERLDRLLRATPGTGQTIGPFTLGPIGGKPRKKGAATRLRIFDTKASALRVWDKTITLQPLLLELIRIGEQSSKYQFVLHGGNIPSNIGRPRNGLQPGPG